MSKLEVRTKGDSSSRGKTKIYFCCTPADKDLYLDTICQDVFATQNCAIYYESEPNADYDKEELELNLSEMKLFIVPITTKFLTEDSRAKRFEYGVAREKDIPILPIAMEEGLENLFTKEMNSVREGYGDIHVINRASRDTTRIPYTEKLADKLNRILVGDKLAERIRKAFDAYVFLSYRKVDRKLAKELMATIHSMEQFRDVAIWYDEFLDPGKEWNPAIVKAIDESQIVTFLMTDNTVTPPNFVIQHEYPMAVERGKVIVPTGKGKVDRSKIETYFAGMSDVVDITDKEQLADKLKSVANPVNDNDPEHNYLIGMAYLSGTDVEKDYSKGISLINEAAEAGNEEAILKLVGMYIEGDGVTRDYGKAVEWQTRYIQVLKEKSEPDFDALCRGYINLGDIYEFLGILGKAKESFEEGLSLSENWLVKKQDATSANLVIVLNERLGDICVAQNRYDEALAYFERCMSLYKGYINAENKAETDSNLSKILARLGNIAEYRKDYDKALDYYYKSYEIEEAVYKATGSSESKAGMAAYTGKIGDLAIKRKMFDLAKEFFERYMIIVRDCCAENASADNVGNMGIAYQRLGFIEEQQGNYAKALEYYHEDLKISEVMFDTLNAKRGRIATYERLGNTYRLSGNLSEAKKYFGMEVELAEAIYSQTGLEEDLEYLAISCERVFLMANSLGVTDEKKEYCIRAINAFNRLISVNAKYEWILQLVSLNEELLSLLNPAEDVNEYYSYLKRHYELCSNLFEKVKTEDSVRAFMKANISMGYFMGCIKEKEKAIGCYRNAEGLINVLIEQGIAKDEEFAVLNTVKKNIEALLSD